MEFDFPEQQGTGVEKLIPNASPDVLEVITKMIAYDQANRMSAGQALKHPYFRDLREADKSLAEQSLNPTAMRTIRIGDSHSQQSKSIISKMSDNASEGSYQNDQSVHKAKNDKLRHTKNGAPGSITGDFKMELGRKTQTFHSDVEGTTESQGA